LMPFWPFSLCIFTIFNKKRHNKHAIAKAKVYPIEIHNVTSRIGRWVGSFEFVTKCEKG